MSFAEEMRESTSQDQQHLLPSQRPLPDHTTAPLRGEMPSVLIVSHRACGRMGAALGWWGKDGGLAVVLGGQQLLGGEGSSRAWLLVANL